MSVIYICTYVYNDVKRIRLPRKRKFLKPGLVPISHTLKYKTLFVRSSDKPDKKLDQFVKK